MALYRRGKPIAILDTGGVHPSGVSRSILLCQDAYLFTSLILPARNASYPRTMLDYLSVEILKIERKMFDLEEK